jgi:DNA gyrase/topoisomerase IV, subunit A
MSAKGMQKAEEQGIIEFFKLVTKINTANMICFDLEGKIKRYGSPEEIIEEFYPKRLAYYQKRKVRLGQLFFSFPRMIQEFGSRRTFWQMKSKPSSRN